MKSSKIQSLIKSFSLTEKTLIGIIFLVFFVSTIVFLFNLNKKFLVEIPERGGVLTEGVIGTPRSINPLLAVSETDRGIVNMIYSGLMRVTDEGLVPDLAEKYEISEDLLTYRFTLRDNVIFHDGTPVTSDDVIFTIVSAQNPELKSPKRSNWEGISIEKINDKEIVFTLKQPYAPFLQNMTLGILPRHIWSRIDINEFNLSIFNSEPIGSGPYQIKKIEKDNIGIPVSYTFSAFKHFALGRPYIKEIVLKFVKNQDELISLYEKNKVDSVYGINPKIARGLKIENKRITTFPLPRVFGLFLNQVEYPVLANKSVRQALKFATPKTEVIDKVLFGFGDIIDSPVPKNLIDDYEIDNTYDLNLAEKTLIDAGWKKNENGIMTKEDTSGSQILSFTITTSNVSELSQAAEIIAESWRKIGANVTVQVFEPGDLNSSVIRPRKFEVLLFGLVIARDLDFYAFWHSSQRSDPGLNITGYANIEMDKALTEIRNTIDPKIIKEKLSFVSSELKKDIPAIFIYSPEFIYVLPESLRGIKINNIISSEERFLNIHEWYLYTDKIWNFFIKN